MGYAVWHSLEIKNSTEKEVIMADLLSENENASCALNEDGTGEEWERWYGIEKDMREFSLKYPGVLFEFTNEGEDGDRWKEYYMDGKYLMASAIITYPEFDDRMMS